MGQYDECQYRYYRPKTLPVIGNRHPTRHMVHHSVRHKSNNLGGKERHAQVKQPGIQPGIPITDIGIGNVMQTNARRDRPVF